MHLVTVRERGTKKQDGAFNWNYSHKRRYFQLYRVFVGSGSASKLSI
jgi:hypothetical protein